MTDYQVITRERSIDATAEDVSAQIVDFHNWVDWSPWEALDPELKRTYSGPDSGIGATYAWDGNRKAGAGTMSITSVAAEKITIDLMFTRPFKSASKTEFVLRETDGQTVVVWSVKTPKTFMTKVAGLFMNMDKTVGADLEKGLNQLNELLARSQ